LDSAGLDFTRFIIMPNDFVETGMSPQISSKPEFAQGAERNQQIRKTMSESPTHFQKNPGVSN
jgi:hypothetical protein